MARLKLKKLPAASGNADSTEPADVLLDHATAIDTLQALVVSGSGTPEAAVTAVVGTLYLRTNGGANTTLYIKESGVGNTGWVAK